MNILKIKKININYAPHSIWTNPIHFIACGFGIGAIPIAPGTFGTAFGVVLYLMIANTSLWMYLAITTFLLIIGIFICQKTNKDFGVPDHSAAVWDEIASFPLVMIAVPQTWYFILLGFLLFRFFDIYKPQPIRWIDEHVKGGIGVMLDDIVAALFSCLIIQAIIWFFIR